MIVAAAVVWAATVVGCASEDNLLEETGLGHTHLTSTGISATGSRRILPPSDGRAGIEDREPTTFVVTQKETLDRQKLATLRYGMTEDELFATFGQPVRKTVAAQDTDTGGEDWNAMVYTWQFQDPDFPEIVLTRDLEVLVGFVHTDHPVPGRDDIVGPQWIVIRWDLD